MTLQQLDNATPNLVPIRLDVKLDGGAHVHDTFCISLATPPADIEQLVSRLCIDAGIEASSTNTQAIIQVIEKQLGDARSAIAQHAPVPGVQLLKLRADLGDVVLQDTLEWDPCNDGDDILRVARLLVQEHQLPASSTAAIECALRQQVLCMRATPRRPTHRAPRHAAHSSVLRPDGQRHRFLSIVRPASPRRSPSPVDEEPPVAMLEPQSDRPVAMLEPQSYPPEPELPPSAPAQPSQVPRVDSDGSNPLLRESSLRHVFDYAPDVPDRVASMGNAAVPQGNNATNVGILPALPLTQMVPAAGVQQDVYAGVQGFPSEMAQGGMYGQAYGMQQPGMQQPGMQQPVMMQPGMQQPGMQQSGMQQPVMQQPVMMQQPIGVPNAAFPGIGMAPDMSPAMVHMPGAFQSGQQAPLAPSAGAFVPPVQQQTHPPLGMSQQPNSFANMW